MKKKKKQKSNWILMTVLVISIVCFVGSGAYLLNYYVTGWQAEKDISQLASLILPDEEISVAEQGIQDQTPDSGSQSQNRYEKLIEMNPDFVGWIEIEGSELSYPVMFTPDEPEYYLHRNFEEEYEYSGLPFADGRCTFGPLPEDAADNTIIYGHNMKNSTMFSSILDYKDKAYYEAHPQVTFNTIYGDGTYEIVSVILSRAFYEYEEGFRYYDFINAGSEEDFDAYMANIHALELYDTGVDAVYGDKLITLSTCEYSQENGRMAIIAKKVD